MPTVGAVMIPVWAAVVLAGVLSALIGLLWRDMRSRIDELSKKLDSHMLQDVQAHERITALEVRSEANKDRIKDVGDRLHRFTAETRDESGKLYKWLVEKFNEVHLLIIGKLVEALKK